MLREFIQKKDRNKLHLFTHATERFSVESNDTQKKYDPRMVARLNNNLSQLKIPIKINNDLTVVSLNGEQSITPAAITYYRWQLWSFYVERSAFFTFILGVLTPTEEKHFILSERLNYTISNLYKLQNRFNQSDVSKYLNIKIMADNGAFHLSGNNYDIASFLFFIHKVRPISFNYSFEELLSAHLIPNTPLTAKNQQQIEIIQTLFDYPKTENIYIQSLFSKMVEVDLFNHRLVGQKLLKLEHNQIIMTFKRFILNYCSAFKIDYHSILDTYIYELALLYLILTEGRPPAFIIENYVSIHMNTTTEKNSPLFSSQIKHNSLSPQHLKVLEDTLDNQSIDQDSLAGIKHTLETVFPLLEIFTMEVLKPKIYLEFSGGDFFANLIAYDLETYLNPNTFEITPDISNADLIMTDNTTSVLEAKITPTRVYLFENFSHEFNKKAFLPWVITNIEAIPKQPAP